MGSEVQSRILREVPEESGGAVEARARPQHGRVRRAPGARPPTCPGCPASAPGPRPDRRSRPRLRTEPPPCRRSARTVRRHRAAPRACESDQSRLQPSPPRSAASMALRPRSTNCAARVASASRSAGVRRSVRSNIASVPGSGSPSATRISKPAARTRRSAKSVEGMRIPASIRPTVDCATPARRASSACVNPARLRDSRMSCVMATARV